MSIIRWLFSKSKRTPDEIPADKRTTPNAAAQLGVASHEVTDEEFAALKIERKRKAREWAALGPVEQQKRRVQDWRAKGSDERKRSMALGITQYKWLWPENAGHDCEFCKRNNGKIFSFDSPPNGSHPGDGYCCPDEHCKCVAISIIPGFED